MIRTSNPLAASDQRVLDALGDGPVTAAQVRAAHERIFGTTAGAGACITRLDRAERLRTKDGRLGFWGAQAAARRDRPAGEAAPPRTPRTPRAPRQSAVPRVTQADVIAEYDRLRALPENRFVPRGALAVQAEDNLAALHAEAERAARPEPAPRAPRDFLARSAPEVQELVRAATAEGGPIDIPALRLIHSVHYGDRPEAEGPEQDAWDHRLALCVPRYQKAGLVSKRVRGAASEGGGAQAERATRVPADPLRKMDPGVRARVEAVNGPVTVAELRAIRDEVLGPRPSEEGDAADLWDRNLANCVTRIRRGGILGKVGGGVAAVPGRAPRPVGNKEGLRVMKEARGELGCLRKHAMAVAKIDADACPVGRSKAEGDALKAEKNGALRELDQLWAAAMKSGSPTDAIGILGNAADVVRRAFPGNRFGYETKAAGVLTAAMGAGAAPAAE